MNIINGFLLQNLRGQRGNIARLERLLIRLLSHAPCLPTSSRLTAMISKGTVHILMHRGQYTSRKPSCLHEQIPYASPRTNLGSVYAIFDTESSNGLVVRTKVILCSHENTNESSSPYQVLKAEI
jgi:hypothetical protein